MVVAEQAGVQMMKEYFEIEASKSIPQYGFRKQLKLFSDKGYQAAKDKLEANRLGRGCIDMLSCAHHGRTLRWIFENER